MPQDLLRLKEYKFSGRCHVDTYYRNCVTPQIAYRNPLDDDMSEDLYLSVWLLAVLGIRAFIDVNRVKSPSDAECYVYGAIIVICIGKGTI